MCDARGGGASISSILRREEVATQHPASLSLSCTRTRTAPTPGHRSRTFLLPSLVVSAKLSPPASSLPTHPASKAPRDATDVPRQVPRKTSFPLLCGQVAGLPHRRPGEGPGRCSVGLGADLGREHRQPHAPREPLRERQAGLRKVLALSQAPTVPGGPPKPLREDPTCRGTEGPCPHSDCSSRAVLVAVTLG